jgi:hypothetical protein
MLEEAAHRSSFDSSHRPMTVPRGIRNRSKPIRQRWSTINQTPPFAYSIFYFHGIAPPQVKLADIYYGCVPFIVLQFLVLIILFCWQDLALYLPNLMLANK